MDKRLTTALVIGSGMLAAAALLDTPAVAQDDSLRAVLRDPSGARVGTVTFTITEAGTSVKTQLRPSSYVAAGAFHGMHIHANGDPANGSGCVADPAAASNTWFTATDGHLTAAGVGHGQHAGDLASPLVLADGTAHLKFTTDRVDPADLVGRAVVLHARPDNFGNVPTAGGSNDYTPNSAGATDLTNRTGNAGDRVACGVISR